MKFQDIILHMYMINGNHLKKEIFVNNTYKSKFAPHRTHFNRSVLTWGKKWLFNVRTICNQQHTVREKMSTFSTEAGDTHHYSLTIKTWGKEYETPTLRRLPYHAGCDSSLHTTRVHLLPATSSWQCHG